MRRVQRRLRRVAVSVERIAHAEQDENLLERVALLRKYLEDDDVEQEV